jgi:cysteine desulfurase
MIYLDYQATTPLAPEAREAMLSWLGGPESESFGNPHSAHKMGRAAAAAVELAREQVAALLPPGGKVIFTSGATEALNLAISGSPYPGDIVTLPTEHAAVLDTVEARRPHVREIITLPVDRDGIVVRSAPFQEIVPGASLVIAMHVNNEIGVIQPLAEFDNMADFAGADFVCDAVQSYGRVPIPAGPAYIAVSAHKIHGPKGIGALWVRDDMTPEPLIHGGGQEHGLRSGTLSPALCAGFGAAAALAEARMAEDARHVEALWKRARKLFSGWTLNGSETARYHGNLNIRRDGLDVSRLMSDVRDVMFSAGSACASGSGRPSHVLRAIGLSDAQAKSSIRLGFGRYTTLAEIEEAVAKIVAAADAQQ